MDSLYLWSCREIFVEKVQTLESCMDLHVSKYSSFIVKDPEMSKHRRFWKAVMHEISNESLIFCLTSVEGCVELLFKSFQLWVFDKNDNENF